MSIEPLGGFRLALVPLLLCGAITIALAAATQKQGQAAYDHHVRLTPENAVIGNFPARKAPILTIDSGDTVRIDGGGGNRWGEQAPRQ